MSLHHTCRLLGLHIPTSRPTHTEELLPLILQLWFAFSVAPGGVPAGSVDPEECLLWCSIVVRFTRW